MIFCRNSCVTLFYQAMFRAIYKLQVQVQTVQLYIVTILYNKSSCKIGWQVPYCRCGLMSEQSADTSDGGGCNLLNETNPRNKTHFFPLEIVLCLQKWGFAASFSTSRATGERKELLFTSTSHAQRDTLVQRYGKDLLSSIALFPCPVFMAPWGWLQDVQADLIVCILRRLNKGGSRGGRQ